MESNAASDVGQSAEELFNSGLYCAESVVTALARSQGLESDLLPRVATAFCGAVTGAIMGIGLALGRSAPGESVAPSYIATQQLIREFEQEFGARDCHVLLGCDLGTPEGQATFREKKLGQRCLQYTGRATEMAARAIAAVKP